jgi:hypothetical protein
MRRRDFLKAGGTVAIAAGVPYVPPHNFDKYDFGSGPQAVDRLNQGPFPVDLYPSWNVVMALTPSSEVVPNYGMGLVTYLCDEVGPGQKEGERLETSLENLAKFPLGTKLYLRVNWKDVQQRPGRLDFCEHWKLAFSLARQYGKRVGFRIMISNPDIPGYALPDFVREKIPLVKLGEWQKREREEPRCDHPYFQSAYNKLIDLLADAFDGHPDVEYVDSSMYGFWGEGHTWPLEKNPYPDYSTAENTFVRMFEYQKARWRKTPLVTNTQPDFSKVGNSELVDRTIRSFNWLRTDTIFIENEQIEALSNRPAWTGVAIEVGLSDGLPNNLYLDEGIPYSDNVIHHARDAGASYFSLWNWHRIRADRLANYYQQFPRVLDSFARCIGYRVRPSWVWTYEEQGAAGLILGLVNDGISGVPGILHISVLSPEGRLLASGGLDAGYPLPGKVRQAQLPLPAGTKWQGLRLKAEIEVKGQRYPVRWACHQKLNGDGSLTLRPTNRLNASDVTGGLT